MATTQIRYPLKMRILHHLTAVLIISLLAVGLYMSDLDKSDPNRSFLYTMHKTFGWFTLWVVILRFWVRKTTTVHFDDKIKEPLHTLAHIGHRILYLFMFVMPLSGWLMSSAAGKNVVLFGIPSLTIPNLISPNKNLAGLFNEVHEICAYTLIAMLIGHVSFALYHTFVEKHNILRRIFF